MSKEVEFQPDQNKKLQKNVIAARRKNSRIFGQMGQIVRMARSWMPSLGDTDRKAKEKVGVHSRQRSYSPNFSMNENVENSKSSFAKTLDSIRNYTSSKLPMGVTSWNETMLRILQKLRDTGGNLPSLSEAEQEYAGDFYDCYKKNKTPVFGENDLLAGKEAIIFDIIDNLLSIPYNARGDLPFVKPSSIKYLRLSSDISQDLKDLEEKTKNIKKEYKAEAKKREEERYNNAWKEFKTKNPEALKFVKKEIKEIIGKIEEIEQAPNNENKETEIEKLLKNSWRGRGPIRKSLLSRVMVRILEGGKQNPGLKWLEKKEIDPKSFDGYDVQSLKNLFYRSPEEEQKRDKAEQERVRAERDEIRDLEQSAKAGSAWAKARLADKFYYEAKVIPAYKAWQEAINHKDNCEAYGTYSGSSESSINELKKQYMTLLKKAAKAGSPSARRELDRVEDNDAYRSLQYHW